MHRNRRSYRSHHSHRKTRRKTYRTKHTRKYRGGVRFFHYSRKPIDSLHNVSNTNVGSIYLKPKGFWVSEEDAWRSWCSYSEFCNLSKYRKYEVTVDVSKLYVVDTVDSLNRLVRNYGKRGMYDGMDWTKLAEDYAGIYFTNYESVKKSVGNNPRMYWFLAVDIDSACIWRPSEAITSLVEVAE